MPTPQSTTLYWFRNDLRLHVQPALLKAAAHATANGQALLLLYVHDPAQDEPTAWGFRRMGTHRRRFLADTLQELHASLQALGQTLVLLHGHTGPTLTDCARRVHASTVFCEEIAAPEEQTQVQSLRDAGLTMQTVWQSSLLEPADLPFDITAVPQVFTTFRQRIEAACVLPRSPLPSPTQLPLPPNVVLHTLPGWVCSTSQLLQPIEGHGAHERSNFPYTSTHCRGGETQALDHLQNYLTPPWPDRYKQTRNALQGQHTSSHWSPWLATGAVSARTIWAALQAYEQEHGANDGTYWLWFELLWRDYFRFLHQQHGRQLYAAKGLSQLPPPSHFSKDFQRWCDGQTGEPIVDAGMRELAATGFTSNRMRQIVASYLVHDLACDWRAGAAWFESQLVDFDVYSNQGNWLYISGRGTDPRQGRRFNPAKQTQDHDPQGRYRQVWLP